MKTTIKILAIVGIITGALAVLGGLDNFDLTAIIGGLWFLGWGICDLVYVDGE